MKTIPSNVTKTYPPRGPLSQFRFADSTAFWCFRCGATKKSKLITIYNGDWSKRLCNGCYGRLLSLYEIKAGDKMDDDRVEELASALLSALTSDDLRQAERVYQSTEKRAKLLSQEAARFIATAEHVAGQLHSDPQLEWSPAVIGFCKAVELEIVSRILIPLADISNGADLSADKSDRDIGHIAKFCSDITQKPPVLGAFAHFLQTVFHSKQRRNTSVVIRKFLQLARVWSDPEWVLNPGSLHRSLSTLINQFRNRAAHIDELGRDDYLLCRDLVIGSQGLIWRLLLSTEKYK